jgi:hypothetical protein
MMKLSRFGLAAIASLALAASATAQVARPVPSAAASSGIVAKDSSGTITAINVTAGASAGFVLVLDSATIPSAGAVTPIKCLPLAASAGIHVAFGSAPVQVSKGATVLFSTGANCFTYAVSATAFISADVQ